MGARRGPLALVAADGAAPVSPGAALLEEMLAGWRRQQQARRLTVRLAGERERVVRQFAAFTGCWPWQWTAAQAEARCMSAAAAASSLSPASTTTPTRHSQRISRALAGRPPLLCLNGKTAAPPAI